MSHQEEEWEGDRELERQEDPPCRRLVLVLEHYGERLDGEEHEVDRRGQKGERKGLTSADWDPYISRGSSWGLLLEL